MCQSRGGGKCGRSQARAPGKISRSSWEIPQSSAFRLAMRDKKLSVNRRFSLNL
jgi:hypothetical protein